ncbi:histidine phosphatase family protein [Noviherbaspirillum aridicola]|uniref:Phosphoglycerate mutase n=1 Tax=Noviherbaspirillum aridicola TaxID=2849687 RepID=A0ABQ4Q4B0_9BURK|nr:histidine phosphatase family protein [Noviherbaspirillum aridicola]GIZ51589.1 phosphoglycerate mutase [Noviherbaspirillum aridicola]
MGRASGRVIAVLALWLTTAIASAAGDSEALWRRLAEGGHVILIRHAVTEPGIGDPPGFRVDDCATQRNLSDAGRNDARRMGEAFRSRGIPVGDVRSSRWCRCLETARLAFGRVVPDPMLDSMFREDERAGAKKVSAVREAIARRTGRGNLVLVTHSQNIIALTGESVRSGEMVVVQTDPNNASLRVVGLLPPESF